MSMVVISLLGKNRFPIEVEDCKPVTIEVKPGAKNIQADWSRCDSLPGLEPWEVHGIEITVDPGYSDSRTRIEMLNNPVRVCAPISEGMTGKGDKFTFNYELDAPFGKTRAA